jgi:hypothetical protein
MRSDNTPTERPSPTELFYKEMNEWIDSHGYDWFYYRVEKVLEANKHRSEFKGVFGRCYVMREQEAKQ